MITILLCLLSIVLGCAIVLRFSNLPLFSWLGTGTLLGIGLSSVLFFLCRFLVPALPSLSLILEVLLVIAVLADLVRTKRAPQWCAKPSGMEWILGAALALVIVIGTSVMFTTYAVNPAGDWDAWSIWSLRAKILGGDAALSSRAWSPMLSGTHPEYPLLVSGFIGRCWAYGGDTSLFAPEVVSYLFWIALLAVAGSGMAQVRGGVMGLVFALILSTSPILLQQVPAQYADIPLAAYCLASLLLLLQKEPLWAGVLAGLAGFTKDEGIVFFVAMSLAVVLFERTEIKKFAAGLATPALVVFSFKGFWAPSNVSLLARGAGSASSQVVNFSRYSQIASAVIGEIKGITLGLYHPLYPVIALAILLGIDRSRWQQLRSPILVCGIMIAGYWGAYVVTTNDLTWQLNTSLNRLFVQVWPMLILTALLSLREIEPKKSA